MVMNLILGNQQKIFNDQIVINNYWKELGANKGQPGRMLILIFNNLY